VQEKKNYFNLANLHTVSSLNFGCYLSINAESLENSEKLFISPGSKFRTASQTFAMHVHEM
jgi:hypothetical protein